ncbi:MAG: hypothetical protein J5758_00865 [Abditibacteriota bacterium]|nr:hypothetical protein [Abditibacteriota bacterium]
MKTKRKTLSALLCILLALIVGTAVCGVTQRSKLHPRSDIDRNAGYDRVIKQCAASEQKTRFEEFLPDRSFAFAVLFCLKWEETPYREKWTVPAYLTTGEYVVFRGKAWPVSQNSGYAVIRFDYTNSGHDLQSVRRMQETQFDKWMTQELGDKAFEQVLIFRNKMKDGADVPADMLPIDYLTFRFPATFMTPEKGLDQQAAKAFGVPVEREKRLRIDRARMTWEIVSKNGKTLEKGRLTAGGKWTEEAIK